MINVATWATNLNHIHDLIKELVDFDWDTYFYTVFGDLDIEITDEERIIVVQPDYFTAVNQLAPR